MEAFTYGYFPFSLILLCFSCRGLVHLLCSQGQPRMQPNAFADENFMHQGWTPLALSSIRDFKKMETVLGK